MLPNLIIIGAQKCGTTSLHYYLGLHPDVSMAWEKELNFFDAERNWRRGLRWYESKFRGRAKIYGESSPRYTLYPRIPGVPKLMHSVIPNAQLIYLVRDPIERIISDYVHFYAEGRENRSLRDSLADLKTSGSVARTKYFMQLEQYLEFYPPSRILVVQTEALYRQRLETLRYIFNFLDVDDTFCSPRFQAMRHESSSKRRKNRVGQRIHDLPVMRSLKRFPLRVRARIENILYYPFSAPVERPVMDDETRQRLIDYLKDDVRQLREFTGNPFAGWSM